MSDQYTDFSICYDLFMDNVPYEKWADDIASELCSNGIEEGLVLDLVVELVRLRSFFQTRAMT